MLLDEAWPRSTPCCYREGRAQRLSGVERHARQSWIWHLIPSESANPPAGNTPTQWEPPGESFKFGCTDSEGHRQLARPHPADPGPGNRPPRPSLQPPGPRSSLAFGE